MTENKDDKPKKLTLSGNKLSLNRSVDISTLTKNFISSRSNTVTVEVKRNKVTSSSNADKYFENDNNNLTNAEVSTRLNILKRAAETSKYRQEQDHNITDNQDLDVVVREDTEVADTNQADIHSIDSLDPQELDIKTNEQNDIILSTTEQIQQKNIQIAEPELSVIEYNKKVFAASNANNIINPISSVVQRNVVSNTDTTVTKIDKGPAPDKSDKVIVNVEDEDLESVKKLADSKVPSLIKAKKEEPKKLKKTEILNLLDEEVYAVKTRSLSSIKRAREKEKRKQNIISSEKIYRDITLPEHISVGDLANRMSERVADVIKELMKLGMIANSSQTIDADTAELVAQALGHSVRRTQESDVENILNNEDLAEFLLPRAPVVTVMGHVDHGKTSLLDALKASDVAAGEAGGITQHIGAYNVKLENDKHITFIDTPGHEAFTEMRVRGAKVTDIVILVVAADDGIKMQTIEAINHAKAANVPIIVAVNKIDKPAANLEKVKNELLNHDLIAEDLGGETIIVPVSALKKTNLDTLLEAVLLVAEMLELKANANAQASGTVIEARVDKGKGIVTTVLVQRGTLKNGDLVVAGQAYGRVKKMLDHKGVTLEIAGPSQPVEIIGLDKTPYAGDQFAVLKTEKQARDISEYRERKERELKISVAKKVSLEDLFSKASGNSMIKELAIIIKGDVQGSIEAIASSLAKIPSQEIRIKMLHTAVGSITESDVALAQASNAMIIGFNVRAGVAAASLADKAVVDIRYYSIIYNLIDDVKSIMSGMLAPTIREEYIGSVDIRQIFNITKAGKIAGSYVTKGMVKRGANVRLLRDNIVIYEGKLRTLKRFKDDVKEVKENFECGIALENYEDIRINDKIEVFEIIEEKRTI